MHSYGADKGNWAIQYFLYIEDRCQDRCQLGLTCKKMGNFIGTSFDLMSSVVLSIKLEKYDFEYLSTVLKSFKNTKRIYPNVTVMDSKATFELLTSDRINCLLNFFDSIGRNIRCLNLSGYVIFPEDLVRFSVHPNSIIILIFLLF
jgi:hypothetical protein